MGFFRSSSSSSAGTPSHHGGEGAEGESAAVIALLKAKIDQLEDQLSQKDGVIGDLERGLQGNLKCLSKLQMRRSSSSTSHTTTGSTTVATTLEDLDDTQTSTSSSSLSESGRASSSLLGDPYHQENLLVSKLTSQLEDKNSEIASLQLQVEQSRMVASHTGEKLKAAEQAKETLRENISALEKKIFDQGNQIECLQALNETNTTIVSEMDLVQSSSNHYKNHQHQLCYSGSSGSGTAASNQWKMYEKLQNLMDNNNKMAQQISTTTIEKQNALQTIASLQKEKLNLCEQIDSLTQEIQHKDYKLEQMRNIGVSTTSATSEGGDVDAIADAKTPTTTTTTTTTEVEEEEGKEEADSSSSPEEQFEELLEHQRRRSSVQTDQIQQVLECLNASCSNINVEEDSGTSNDQEQQEKYKSHNEEQQGGGGEVVAVARTTDVADASSSSDSTDPKLLQLSLQVCQSQLKQIQKEHELQMQKTVQQSILLAESRSQVDTLTAKVEHYENLMDKYIKTSLQQQQQQQQKQKQQTIVLTPGGSSTTTTTNASKAARQFMNDVDNTENTGVVVVTPAQAAKSPSSKTNIYASYTRNTLKRLSLPKFMNLRVSGSFGGGGGGGAKSPITTPTLQTPKTTTTTTALKMTAEALESPSSSSESAAASPSTASTPLAPTPSPTGSTTFDTSENSTSGGDDDAGSIDSGCDDHDTNDFHNKNNNHQELTRTFSF